MIRSAPDKSLHDGGARIACRTVTKCSTLHQGRACFRRQEVLTGRYAALTPVTASTASGMSMTSLLCLSAVFGEPLASDCSWLDRGAAADSLARKGISLESSSDELLLLTSSSALD